MPNAVTSQTDPELMQISVKIYPHALHRIYEVTKWYRYDIHKKISFKTDVIEAQQQDSNTILADFCPAQTLRRIASKAILWVFFVTCTTCQSHNKVSEGKVFKDIRSRFRDEEKSVLSFRLKRTDTFTEHLFPIV